MRPSPIHADASADDRPTWLVVGSAPSAPRWIDAGLRLADHTITTNSGWQLFQTAEPPCRPDIYWLHDGIAIGLHARAARWMQKRGTVILTSQTLPEGLGVGLVEGRGKIKRVELGSREQHPPRSYHRWKPGDYVNGRTSGAICVQHAVADMLSKGQRGRVLLVGMDGYRSKPQKVIRDTFDGRMGKGSGRKVVDEWQAPLLRAIVAACPHIEFVWCGIPNYTADAPNTRIVTDPSELFKEPDVKIQFNQDVNGHEAGDKLEVSARAAKLLVSAGVANLVGECPAQQENEDDGQAKQPVPDPGPGADAQGSDPEPDRPAD